VYRLSAAIAPLAQQVWVACGPGHNGHDGLIAATHWAQRLRQMGRGTVTVTLLPTQRPLSAETQTWMDLARDAGVVFDDTAPDLPDLAIDALYGIGLDRTVHGVAADWIRQLQRAAHPVVCVDVPSGLDADRGCWWVEKLEPRPSPQRHTLALLTLKAGLFTHNGRTASGRIWWDDLQTADEDRPSADAVTAWLYGPSGTNTTDWATPQSHKGTRGDLIVIGGQDDPASGSMRGAALLAARAGLRAGAGRVFVGLLAASSAPAIMAHDPTHPELMFRPAAALSRATGLPDAVTVCGCGGGKRVSAVLHDVLRHPGPVVLDADALNAIARQPDLQATTAQRHAHGRITVLSPHPLEAARLLDTSTQAVQDDRLAAAQALATRYCSIVALKGSGTVITAPGACLYINPTGNGLLSTGGTGDVLAGLIGASLCGDGAADPLGSVLLAVYRHGLTADHWPGHQGPMVASDVIAQWAP